MKTLKKNVVLLILFLSHAMVIAQYEIKPKEGYDPQIGIKVAMLEEHTWTDKEDEFWSIKPIIWAKLR